MKLTKHVKGSEIITKAVKFDEDMYRGDGQQIIMCPVCKHPYTHVREAFTRFGTDPNEGGSAYPGTSRRASTRISVGAATRS
jgi:hypothetical protein